jgi:hypothetical protein
MEFEMTSPELCLRIGVLIIGSLYWDDRRDAWRRSRLDLRDVHDVRTRIRYRRCSTGRDDTYTMVFSQDAAEGQAKVVRCQRDVVRQADLNAEAEELWAAEKNSSSDGSIASNRGCVALLCNGSTPIQKSIMKEWADRVKGQLCYGSMQCIAGEEGAVGPDGLLQIEWPVMVATGEPVPFDLLIATVNAPTLKGEPLSYPTPQVIGSAWSRAKAISKDRAAYFRNNIACGIRTFEDARIAEHLASVNKDLVANNL